MRPAYTPDQVYGTLSLNKFTDVGSREFDAFITLSGREKDDIVRG